MRKTATLFLLSSLCAFSAGAQTTPVLDWANIFDGQTSSGDQAEAVSPASDGGAYWHLVGGTTEALPDINYAGETLFRGALYNAGNSMNNNLCILRTAPDGTAAWNLHSDCGDFDTNDGNVATTSDGGAVFTAKVRHTDGMLDKEISIVDGTGKNHTYEWNAEKRYYRLVVGRLSAEGELLWTRFIDFDTVPAPAAAANNVDFISDACSIPGLALDADDNIYISGNYRSDMYIASADSTVTLSPRNVAEWNGNSQTSAGDLFIVKLNSEGYYLDNLATAGSATSETVSGLVYDNGCVYFHGLVMGNGSELSVGDATVKPEGDFTPLLGCLGTDMQVKWVTPLKGEKLDGKYGYQNCAISVCGDRVWYTGQFNGSVYTPAGELFFESSQASMREGFLSRIDALTGACVKGVSSRPAYDEKVLTGYLGAIQNSQETDKVYVFGYGMNATVGEYLRAYDAETLESNPEAQWTLATQGGVPSATVCAYDEANGRFFFNARGNKPFEIDGETVGENTTWAILLASYTLPEADFPTSVNSIVNAPAMNGDVYNLQGIKVASDGNLSNLPAGIYIVNGRKVICN